MSIELGGDLGVRLADLERKVDWLTRRDVLANASIDQGGLDVNDGSINVKSGQSVNVLNGGSVNVLNGGAVFVNGLQLSAVRATSINGWASNFAIPLTDTIAVTTTVTVPAGFTTAIITALGPFEFANNNTGPAVVQGGINLTTSTGSWTGENPWFDMQIPGGATMSMTCALGAVVTGISPSAGQNLVLTGHVLSGTAISTNAYNAFALVGTVVFTA